MISKILFAVGLGASVIFIVWYLSNQKVSEPNLDFAGGTESRPGGGSVAGDNSGGFTRLPDTVASTDENPPSDSEVTNNQNANEVGDDFFELSGDNSLYGVYYDKPSGSFTITLYGEDTKKARDAAEIFIKKQIKYTAEQWCSFPVTVITNEYENPRWAGINLGLSFCPGSVQL